MVFDYVCPEKQGLYDPAMEQNSCGVGFIAQINGEPAHSLVKDSIQVLVNLEHRGAIGSDLTTGDGAGILLQIPHEFLVSECAEPGLTCRKTVFTA